MADLEVEIVLKLKSSGRYVTREEIVESCGAPPAEVAAAVAALNARGYRIDDVPGEGYRLLATPGSLDGCDIRTRLKSHLLGREILTFRRVTSTNDVASALARGGAGEGAVVIAEEQSRGRGRMGRDWHSPPGTGLWFSIILRPSFEARESSTISLAAAVGVATALDRAYGVKAQIKWPNDVMVRGRKICGILTEGEFIGNEVSFVVVGVGLNILTRSVDFPVGLRDTSTSLRLETGEEIVRTRVFSDVLASIEDRYIELCSSGFENIRRDILGRSMLVGRLVKVTTGTGGIEGVAQDIDSSGALIVRKENGAVERILAGDVVRVA